MGGWNIGRSAIPSSYPSVYHFSLLGLLGRCGRKGLPAKLVSSWLRADTGQQLIT